MNGVEELILSVIANGGKEAILSLGWLLYLLERYVYAPRREKEFRQEVSEFRANYKEIAEKLSTALSNFSTILEVVKDRIGRGER